MRLGYACINLTLGAISRTNRTCRLANATRHRLESLARQNLQGLFEILRWNVSQHIMLFRISSGIIPLASHPKAQWPWEDILEEEISQIGDFARKHELRLSMHPGQYTVLNSPAKGIVTAAEAELSYHARFLDMLGLSSEHKIILHVGGVYDDRAGSIQRFRDNFHALPEEVKSRLVLENDERNYNATDVLTLCESLKVPMVFDYLHHQAYNNYVLDDQFLDRVYSTWSVRDGLPKLHFSTQKHAARIGAHANMINAKGFIRFMDRLPGHDIDVMLEAKSKEKTLLKLRKSLSEHESGGHFFLID